MQVDTLCEWLNEAESLKTKVVDNCKTCWCVQAERLFDGLDVEKSLTWNKLCVWWRLCACSSAHTSQLRGGCPGTLAQIRVLRKKQNKTKQDHPQQLAGVWLAWLALISRSCRRTLAWLSFSLLGYEPFLFLTVEASLGMGPTHSSSSPSPPSPWSSSAFRLSSTLFSDSAIAADLPCGPFWITVLPFNACTSEFSPPGLNSNSLISSQIFVKSINYLQRQFLWGVCFRLVIH